MSISFYPQSWEIHVENAGYGELELVARPNPRSGPALVTTEWARTLAGAEIGTLLQEITARAFQNSADPAPLVNLLPAFVTPPVARRLLPALQEAVLAAVAGEERYERILPGENAEPARPYCARCADGALSTTEPSVSDWCQRYGHRPFGFRSGISWDDAAHLVEMDQRSWQRDQDLRRTEIR